MNLLYEIEGYLTRLIFENEHTDYRVYLFKLDDLNEKQLTINGTLPRLPEDIKYILSGEYQEHPRYGMQFTVASYRSVLPTEESMVVKFLSSSLFPGIGLKSAQKFVDAYGSDILNRIKNGEEVYINPKVLSVANQQVLIEGIRDHVNLEEAISFFTTKGLGVRMVMKIERMYGKDAIAKISENPYIMIDDIDGIGFKTCDQIALQLEFPLDHPFRLNALLIYETMQQCMETGSTYTTVESLQARLYKKGMDADTFETTLENVIYDKKVIQEEQRLYHHTQHEAEVVCANYFSQNPRLELDPLEFDLDELIETYEETMNIQYDESQKKAINSFFLEKKSIITGGPGTGKTTIIQAIIYLFRECYPQYELAVCAPTGRAAKRLKELVNVDVTTIHSLLEWDLESNTFGRNESNPVLSDILIIDEFSMVDSWTMAALCKATPRVRRILFIGDQDQLPSVAPGFLIRDLIASNHFVVNVLDVNYRQASGSQIIELAHSVRQGIFDKELCKGEIRFIQTSKYLLEHLTQVVASALDTGYNISDIQVLATKYNGSQGIDTLNFVLQKLCNPPAKDKRELKIGYQLFREGDKILQLKNQPDDHVYNGDIGRLVEITLKEENSDNKNHMIVDFEGTIVEYTPDMFINLKHAYCMSVHKAQGSEYPIVIMVGTKQHQFMMQRRLLYTAITRSSKALILMGEEAVFLHGAKNDHSNEIKTTLIERMTFDL